MCSVPTRRRLNPPWGASVDARYLIRLDDACATQDRGRWDAVEAVLDRYGIKPIVAIVPANGDRELVRGPEDPAFWDRTRNWERQGWTIALHGYSHVLRPLAVSGGPSAARSLVPVNEYGEFTGLSAEEQDRRVQEGLAILQSQGLTPRVFVAPAHSFDLQTLTSLQKASPIRVISDGFSFRPYRRFDFLWLPQQLWRPRAMGPGLWTVCLHPNTMTKGTLDALESFFTAHRSQFPSPSEVIGEAQETAGAYGIQDALFGAAFTAALRAKRLLAPRRRGPPTVGPPTVGPPTAEPTATKPTAKGPT